MIRTVRPTDLVRLGLFLRQASTTEITGHTWPKVQPESGHQPLGSLIQTALGLRGAFGGACVAVDASAITGLVVGRTRSSGLVWDVEHLQVADQASTRAHELLDGLCQAAVASGARRVFLDVPVGGGHADVARRAGFERYTESAVCRIDPPFRVSQGDHFEGRPRLRADEQGLFQLYNAAVPAVVRSAEACSYEEWSSLHRGRRTWTPSLFGDRHQYVWELGEGLAGWMEVIYGQKSQYLELLIHPRYETLLDRFVGYGLKQVSEKAAVYAAVREYQKGLATAFERVGFKLVDRHDVYVRQLTVRVPERNLMPAKIVGG